jgi:uncharacterized LabA/DUF88 family protein
MSDKKDPKKVMVFIDGNNLFHRMWDFYRQHIDIPLMAETLCGEFRELKQIRYYYSPFVREVNAHIASEQQAYVNHFESNPLVYVCRGKYIRSKLLLKKEVRDRLADSIQPGDLTSYVEKGIDVQIAVDMIGLGLKKEYDTAILISTDSDFVPVVNYLQSEKIKIQVGAFQDGDHSCFDLKNNCKSFINLHHYVPAILRKQKSRSQK